VHPVGRAMNAEQLVQTVSGRALTSEPFLSYLEDKLDRVLATSSVCGT
jgi:carboxypeptidase Taq